jgi:hypothetical protein
MHTGMIFDQNEQEYSESLGKPLIIIHHLTTSKGNVNKYDHALLCPRGTPVIRNIISSPHQREMYM